MRSGGEEGSGAQSRRPMAIQTLRGSWSVRPWKAVEGQSGCQADDPFRHAHRRFREAVLGVEFGVGKLVEAARQTHDFTVVCHACHGRRRNARCAEIRQPRHTALG